MVNFNGALLERTSPFLNHTNRGLLFGDVLFEEVRAIHGQIVFWEDHYFRLMASMRILRMEIPMEFTMEFLEEQILSTLESNGFMEKPALVRITVFRDGGTTLSPEQNNVSFVLDTMALSAPFYNLDENAYEVELFKDYLINDDMLSKLDTNNKTVEVVASIFARENGYSDCILLNTKKHVVGTIHGSIFLVKDGKIKIPPLSEGAKNRVLRKKLYEIIQAIDGFEIEEAVISPFELQKADELFVVNNTTGIQPITQYRKKVYGNKTARNLLGKLNANARLASLK